MDTLFSLLRKAYHFSDPVLHDLQKIAQHTAEPKTVWQTLQRFFETYDKTDASETLIQALKEPLWRQRLVMLIGNSPYLSTVLHRWPHFLSELMQQPFSVAFTPEERTHFLEQVNEWHNQEQAMAAMRHQKHRAYFRIGMADLNREVSLEAVTESISDLADLCLEAGFRWLYQSYCRKFGEPYLEDQNQQIARFVVLGMGKLGGQELNFSSDVDLIFLYEGNGYTQGGARSISVKDFYTRLGRELCNLMQKMTADGIVFRTDLRLRPEGESGELCPSLESAELYYESWGQTWERSAMIKARPVAGHLALGIQFLKNIRPFVYRRHLDFQALAALRGMKRKIDQKIRRKAEYRRNVKLGYGGIREIEFFVQCQQLIHGGKELTLRHRQTIPMLRMLTKHGLVSREKSQFLIEAYRFLRTVEHRLQIVREQQTHSTPENQEDFDRLAKRCGFQSSALLQEELDRITRGVHEIYGDLFFEGERIQKQEREDPMIHALLSEGFDSEKAADILEEAGFEDTPKTRRFIQLLSDGPQGAGFTETTRRWYDRLAPLILKEILNAPDRKMAMKHTENFLRTVWMRSNYLALLAENPVVVHLLIHLFGTSAYLSHFLNSHPELLDSLVASDFLSRYLGHAELAEELETQICQCNSREDRVMVLRKFKNSETLRISLRDLAGLADLPEVMGGISAIADTVLWHVLKEARQDLEEKYGVPRWSDGDKKRRAQFAILAMGKLGGSELSYASDLDLIFVHDSQGEEQWTDGKNSYTNRQFFTRLGQRILSDITAMTKHGKLYEIDMRLRPSGNSGPLVTSLEAFCQYQQKQAWTWEHQALTRARPVVGDKNLCQRLQKEIKTILTRPRDQEKVLEDILEMRQRLWKEKRPGAGVVDIKQSRGGIVDIEFFIQSHLLIHGHRYPNIVRPNASQALYAFKKVGLLDKKAFNILEESYQFLRLVGNRTRLFYGRSENRIFLEDDNRKKIAKLCGLDKEEEIFTVIEHHFDRVSKIIEKVLPRS
ncbi:bifunctional [glutamate--ammonia ligase]-adenylyl-L-tyrosine phosphorylase/[glutamate--ammonia-ligase] adenylyltransferase [Magnetococcales bacterium HHB-1]